MFTRTDTVTLAERQYADVLISLAFDFNAEEVIVSVKSATEDFKLYPPNVCALDCFHHPYAYAARVLTRGTYAEVSS